MCQDQIYRKQSKKIRKHKETEKGLSKQNSSKINLIFSPVPGLNVQGNVFLEILLTDWSLSDIKSTMWFVSIFFLFPGQTLMTDAMV